jgi:hypothetical protein
LPVGGLYPQGVRPMSRSLEGVPAQSSLSHCTTLKRGEAYSFFFFLASAGSTITNVSESRIAANTANARAENARPPLAETGAPLVFAVSLLS